MALNDSHLVGNAHRLLAIARRLARIYRDVLDEPVPAKLHRLIVALESMPSPVAVFHRAPNLI